MYSPVPKKFVKPDDHIDLIILEFPSLNVGLQIVQPPQSAALPAPIQTYKLKKYKHELGDLSLSACMCIHSIEMLLVQINPLT